MESQESQESHHTTVLLPTVLLLMDPLLMVHLPIAVLLITENLTTHLMVRSQTGLCMS